MARSKYINTFDTTAEYNNYIESALPAFPNVGYDKEADKVNIVRTSPNDHVLYGEVVDKAQALPTISLNGTTNNTTLDELNNAFYLDSWSNASPTSISFGNKSNIKSIKKFNIDTSKFTNKDSTSQIKEEVKKSLQKYRFFHKRLFKAFPNIERNNRNCPCSKDSKIINIHIAI